MSHPQKYHLSVNRELCQRFRSDATLCARRLSFRVLKKSSVVFPPRSSVNLLRQFIFKTVILTIKIEKHPLEKSNFHRCSGRTLMYGRAPVDVLNTSSQMVTKSTYLSDRIQPRNTDTRRTRWCLATFLPNTPIRRNISDTNSSLISLWTIKRT
jgi:hypothetical protein